MSTLRTLRLSALTTAIIAMTGCSGGDGNMDLASQGGSGNTTNTTSASVTGPLDPVQGVVGDVLGNVVAGALPAPLNATVDCIDGSVNALTDVPDAILSALLQLPNGADPAAAFNSTSAQVVHSLQLFAARLQGGLMQLAGQGQGCNAPVSGNPLAGTPLEAVGAPLGMLISQLNGFSTQSANGQDLNLTTVTGVVAPLLESLSLATNALPADVKGAPVVGGLLGTVSDLTHDLSLTLNDAGDYDAVGTQASITSLLDHTLSNVLLHVIPVAEIDAQTGQNFSGQIQGGIDTVTGELGNGLGTLLDPLFNQLLDGALSPALDPIEGLLAQLLGKTSTVAPADPLNGLLGTLAGNGAPSLDPLLALLNTGAQGGSFGSLLGSLSLPTSGTPLDGLLALSSPTTGTPLDGLLGLLLGGLN